MRLSILDAGSNTVHLAMVDVHRGGYSTPMSDPRSTMKLVEYLDKGSNLSKRGIDKLTSYAAKSEELAEQMKCGEMISFVTSAARDATNANDVFVHVENETGTKLQILSGEDEARLTFLAIRRWYG